MAVKCAGSELLGEARTADISSEPEKLSLTSAHLKRPAHRRGFSVPNTDESSPCYSSFMKVGDVLRLVHADGWILVATRGSHRQYSTRTSLIASLGQASQAMISLPAR